MNLMMSLMSGDTANNISIFSFLYCDLFQRSYMTEDTAEATCMPMVALGNTSTPKFINLIINVNFLVCVLQVLHAFIVKIATSSFY